MSCLVVSPLSVMIPSWWKTFLKSPMMFISLLFTIIISMERDIIFRVVILMLSTSSKNWLLLIKDSDIVPVKHVEYVNHFWQDISKEQAECGNSYDYVSLCEVVFQCQYSLVHFVQFEVIVFYQIS